MQNYVRKTETAVVMRGMKPQCCLFFSVIIFFFTIQATPKSRGPDSVQVIDLEDSPHKGGENGSESLTAVKERLRRRQSLEIRQLESEPDDSESEGEPEAAPAKPQDGENENDEDDQPTEGESDG